MKHRFGLWLTMSLLIAGLAFGIVRMAWTEATAPTLSKATLTVQGKPRTFEIYTPVMPQAKPLPVLLMFHGYRGQGETIRRQTGWDHTAARNGFLVVYPDALNDAWTTQSDTNKDDTSEVDVQFVQAILDYLKTSRQVDTQRIYAAGFSNGGFFTQRLACELSDRLAAVATVSSTMGVPLSQECHPKRAVPILMMHGTSDPVVTMQGEIKRVRHAFPYAKILSSADTVQFWVKQDGCTEAAPTAFLLDAGKRPTPVEYHIYKPCHDNAEVQQWIIHGGGHTWPGSNRTGLIGRLVSGKTSQDIQANDVIWQFFASHSLSAAQAQ